VITIAFIGCPGDTTEPVEISVYRQSFDEDKPQCRLFLKGARIADIHLENSSLVHRLRERPARYEIYGTGSFVWSSQTIQINYGNVLVNGAALPEAEFKSFVIFQNGRVANGYISSAR
jgi:hypothetical protein